ncbi:MAG: septum site-determining protein MinC [Pseudomonadota bacterium]
MIETERPYQIRGTTQTLLALRVDTPDDPTFFDLLKTDVLKSPAFYKNAPVVIDVQPILDQPTTEFRKFVARVRASGMQPIGVINGDETWNKAAAAVGLSVLAAGAPAKLDAAPSNAEPPRAAPSVAERGAAEAAPTPPAARPAPAAMVVEETVRGGQQVYARDGDAICLASISNGADVVATGNVHVYAALRGRAFAGFDGDQRAMIFCDRLEAELVSIAGFHLVSEELPAVARGKRVRVRCADGGLVVDVVS